MRDRKGTPPNLNECRACEHSWQYYGPAEKCPSCGSSRVTCRCNSRRKGGRAGRCRQVVKRGGRCNAHGGKSLAGHAAPATTHGLYIQVLPERYREGMEAALRDPDLLSLRTELALLHERQRELLGRLSEQSSGAAVRAARVDLKRFLEALQLGEAGEAEQAEALGALRQHLAAAQSDEDAWGELVRVMEQRRKHTEAEARRVERLRAYMTVDQVLWLVGQAGQLVREVIGDVIGTALKLVAKSQREELERQGRIAYSQFARRMEALIGRGRGPVPPEVN